jgi:hypothetical protein
MRGLPKLVLDCSVGVAICVAVIAVGIILAGLVCPVANGQDCPTGNCPYSAPLPPVVPKTTVPVVPISPQHPAYAHLKPDGTFCPHPDRGQSQPPTAPVRPSGQGPGQTAAIGAAMPEWMVAGVAKERTFFRSPPGREYLSGGSPDDIDDSKLLRLTVVGPEQACERVMADLAGSTALGRVRDLVIADAARPDDWRVKGIALVGSGNPDIFLQLPPTPTRAAWARSSTTGRATRGPRPSPR